MWQESSKHPLKTPTEGGIVNSLFLVTFCPAERRMCAAVAGDGLQGCQC